MPLRTHLSQCILLVHPIDDLLVLCRQLVFESEWNELRRLRRPRSAGEGGGDGSRADGVDEVSHGALAAAHHRLPRTASLAIPTHTTTVLSTDPGQPMRAAGGRLRLLRLWAAWLRAPACLPALPSQQQPAAAQCSGDLPAESSRNPSGSCWCQSQSDRAMLLQCDA